MAAIASAASGNWSVGATWVGGFAPVGGASGDDVTIAKNHVITLDNTSCVAKSLKLAIGTTGADVGGKLVASTTANSKLQVHQGILGLGSTGGTAGSYSSTFELDMSAASAYTCTIAFNDAQATTSSSTDPTASGTMYVAGKATFKGAAKSRWTFTQAALVANTTKSVGVDDATGWKVGDILVFATTQAYNATPRVDKVTIDTITPGSGTTATVTWVDGTGTGGAVLYGHDTSCLVGNFTSNLRFVPTVAQKPHTIALASAHAANNVACDNAEFYRCHCSSAFGVAGIYNPVSSTTTPHSLSNCAFYDPSYSAVMIYAGGRLERSNNVYYAPTSMSAPLVNIQSPVGTIGDDTDTCIFQANITGAINCAMQTGGIGMTITRPKISGVLGRAAFGTTGSYGDARVVQGGVWSCLAVDARPNVQNGFVTFEETYLGKGIAGHVYANANNANISQLAGSGSVDYVSCLENLTGGARADAIGSSFGASETRFYNKDGDAAVQEIYATAVGHTAPVYTRATDVTKNANASLKIATLAASTFKRTFSVLVKGGAAATIHVWARKSSSSFTTRPTAQLTGLGTAFAAVTMTDVNDTWELLDLSYSAGSAPTSDGLLTLTLSAASSGASDTAHFSGIPLAPFVTRCRHYGYLFDETTPTRTVDITKSVTEATAAAYNTVNMTFSWSTTAGSSTTSIIADTTFQQLFDGHQAQAVLNVDKAIALHGAGVAGAPSLFADGNVTVATTKKLSGGGSLDMGSKLLTSDSPWAFTYTGGTFSRATTTAAPSFSGGTLNIGAAGTYTYIQAAAMILSMTPTAPGTYALGATTFTGQVDLRNTAAHAITVELPTGTSYTTASNTGGTITVSLPVVTADISITSMPDAGDVPTRLQIINSTATGASTWVANTVYATGAIVKRTTGLGSESTAGLYFRATTGGTSHATTEPTWDTTVGNTTVDNTVVWTTYAILYYDDDPAATSLTDTYIDGEEFLDGESVEVRFAEMDGSTSFKTYSTTAVVNSAGFSVLVSEDADDVYATNALDGSDYESTFSPNFTLDYMVLDTNTDFAGKAAFAYYCYTLTTSAGMWGFWGGVTALDEGNYRVNTAILNLYFDESAGFVKQTDNVRIFRDDGLRPAIDPTTGGHGIEINWRTPVNVVTTGGSALTAPESAQLMALPSAIANANAVAAVAVDGATTLAESLALQNSILAGKVSGAGSGTETFRDLADTKNRVVSTVDVDGNRTAVTLDAT